MICLYIKDTITNAANPSFVLYTTKLLHSFLYAYYDIYIISYYYVQQ